MHWSAMHAGGSKARLPAYIQNVIPRINVTATFN